MKIKKLFLVFILFITIFNPKIIIIAKEDKTVEKTNEELKEEYEQLEKSKKNKDKVKKQIDKNKKEVEELEEEAVQLNKKIKKTQEQLNKREKEAQKILKMMQKYENINVAILLVSEITSSKDFTSFSYKYKAINTIFKEVDTKMKDISENLKNLKKDKQELDEKIKHLDEVNEQLEKELKEFLEIKDKNSAYLERSSRTFYNENCKEDEVYGVDCGKKLKKAKDFKVPIKSGYVTNEYGGWDALDQSDGHTGIDMAGDKNIHPSAPGEVVDVTVDAYGGIQVLMIHNVNGENYVTNYAHLSEVNVVPGDILTTKDTLGIMGDTGVATGVHLHFEIIQGAFYIHSRLEEPRDYIILPPIYVEFNKK